MWTTLLVLWLPTVLGTVQLLGTTSELVSIDYYFFGHIHVVQLPLRQMSCVD